MRITINDRPASCLSDDQEEDVRLSREWSAVDGSVLDSGAAASRILFRWRIVCIAFQVLVWLVLYVVVSGARSGDRAFLGTFGLAMAVLMPFVLGLVYYVKRERLYASLPERARASPPTGTAIRVDCSGIAIGSRTAAWKDVAVDGVDFSVVTGTRGYRAYYIRRLHLRLNDVPFVLDRSLLNEGEAIVDGIYRHKFR
jgi:hypothetical protein